MFKNYNNNTAKPSSEGSISSAVVWLSLVVLVALSALYLALSDVSVSKRGNLAQWTGVSAAAEHDARNVDAFIHQEPFGIDYSLVNTQNLQVQPDASAQAIADYSVTP